MKLPQKGSFFRGRKKPPLTPGQPHAYTEIMAGYYEKRIDRAFGKAKAINREDHQKLVFFSDCHRGDGSWSDSFLHNKILYQAALDYYWKAGFSYVEVGDGDELWENRSFRRIREIHGDVFDSLSRFALSGRMFMLAGNHDKVKLKTCAEALVIKNRGEKDIFVIHGHQADFFNDKLWPLARFMVRYLWRPLELSGFKDPTSAARNYRKGSAVENRLISWAKKNDKNIMAGHTHRPAIIKIGERNIKYLNTGSCVHPNGITCIELSGEKPSLVRWTKCVDENRRIYVCRQILS